MHRILVPSAALRLPISSNIRRFRMRKNSLTVLLATILLASCSKEASVPIQIGTVITVSDTTYLLGSSTAQSKSELLALIKATTLHEPVVVNWSIQGGNDTRRALAENRAAEVRSWLKEAGISVSVMAVGNEIFGKKP